ncbi:hypothetical protein [Nocardioides zeae]|uniref:Lipoprotein n=1 Tax=Nocardioides zeae TaxID=1457234 RepID=A0A6P0HGU7_9ACTN|nr:hypothetical protein [Nocardioides zeae]NEN77912.1 hypothetical protein [Nocardioides zeae]
MTAVRRVLATTAAVAALGATAGCTAVSVGEATLARAADGTYVLLVEICDDDPEVTWLFVDEWETRAPGATAGRSYSVVLTGLDVSAVPPRQELYIGGWTEDVNHSLPGPDITAAELVALRPGELISTDDDGHHEATATTESDWRADACVTR